MATHNIFNIGAPPFSGYYNCTFESLTTGALATYCGTQSCADPASSDNKDGGTYSYGALSSSTEVLVNATDAWSGSKCAEIFMDTDDIDMGMGFGVPDHSVYNGDEIWFKLDVKLPVGFDTSLPEVGKTKFMRITINNAHFDLMMMSDDTGKWHVQNSELMPTEWNAEYGSGVSNLGPGMTFGNDYSVECYMKIHETAGSGIIRCWQDGVLFFEDDVVATIPSSPATLKSFILIGGWNNGVNSDQSFFIDNVKITTNSDGTGGALDAAGNKMIGP